MAEEWERRLMEELGGVEGLAGAGADLARAAAVPDTRGDLVALDSAFDPARIDPDLAAALDVHRQALVGGDRAALADQIVPSARDAVLEIYGVAGTTADAPVVACARVGAYRFVKLALRGPREVSIVQLEWRRDEAGWRIVAAERIRSEPVA